MGASSPAAMPKQSVEALVEGGKATAAPPLGPAPRPPGGKEVIGTAGGMGILVEGVSAREAQRLVDQGKFKDEIAHEKTEISAEELEELRREREALRREIEEKHAELEK